MTRIKDSETVIEVFNDFLVTFAKKVAQDEKSTLKESKNQHDTYCIKHRKDNGKTITSTINKTKATMLKKAIKEMKEVNYGIQKWRALSLKEIEKCGK